MVILMIRDVSEGQLFPFYHFVCNVPIDYY